MQPCNLHSVYMKRLNKTKSPVFVLLCNLYFQRKPCKLYFRFLLDFYGIIYKTPTNECKINGYYNKKKQQIRLLKGKGKRDFAPRK